MCQVIKLILMNTHIKLDVQRRIEGLFVDRYLHAMVNDLLKRHQVGKGAIKRGVAIRTNRGRREQIGPQQAWVAACSLVGLTPG